jgi:hypothetical protein
MATLLELCTTVRSSSLEAIHNWVEKLSQGHLKVASDARSGAEVAETTVKKTSILRVSTHR